MISFLNDMLGIKSGATVSPDMSSIGASRFPKPKKDLRMMFFMAFGMAFFMSMGMSLVMVLVNVGIDAFPWIWLRSWSIGFAIALPLSFILPLALRSLANKLGFLPKSNP